jgi:hypothetical protein
LAFVTSLAAGAGCIKENPAFVESDTEDKTATTANGTTSEPGSSGDASAGDTTAATCEPMAPTFEPAPFDIGSIAAGDPGGSTQGILTPQIPEAWYELTVTPGSTMFLLDVFVSVEPNTVDVCVYAQCAGEFPNLSTIVMCPDSANEEAMSPAARNGCCGDDFVRLTYACGKMQGETQILVHLTAPEDIAACLPVEFGYSVSGL